GSLSSQIKHSPGNPGRFNELIFPSLRRAKSDVQKWERVCAALRELNKHRDIVRQITDSSRRVVSEK
ncbi:DUF1627 domain-containing protein, partial [Escherichia coli]|uniref:DUF1627 domain-containing protein n=1 Tax=Escherichia coli TaxID=562 RepID=UPI0031B564E7